MAHFAFARIVRADFESVAFTIVTRAQAPLPVKKLHIGRLIVDHEGNEVGTLKPWQV